MRASWFRIEKATSKGSINTLAGNNGECQSISYQQRKQKPVKLAGAANTGFVPAIIKTLVVIRQGTDHA